MTSTADASRELFRLCSAKKLEVEEIKKLLEDGAQIETVARQSSGYKPYFTSTNVIHEICKEIMLFSAPSLAQARLDVLQLLLLHGYKDIPLSDQNISSRKESVESNMTSFTDSTTPPSGPQPHSLTLVLNTSGKSKNGGNARNTLPILTGLKTSDKASTSKNIRPKTSLRSMEIPAVSVGNANTLSPHSQPPSLAKQKRKSISLSQSNSPARSFSTNIGPLDMVMLQVEPIDDSKKQDVPDHQTHFVTVCQTAFATLLRTVLQSYTEDRATQDGLLKLLKDSLKHAPDINNFMLIRPLRRSKDDKLKSAHWYIPTWHLALESEQISHRLHNKRGGRSTKRQFESSASSNAGSSGDSTLSAITFVDHKVALRSMLSRQNGARVSLNRYRYEFEKTVLKQMKTGFYYICELACAIPDYIDVLQILKEYGASINSVCMRLESDMRRGPYVICETPLHLAIRMQNLALFKFLLVDINADFDLPVLEASHRNFGNVKIQGPGELISRVATGIPGLDKFYGKSGGLVKDDEPTRPVYEIYHKRIRSGQTSKYSLTQTTELIDRVENSEVRVEMTKLLNGAKDKLKTSIKSMPARGVRYSSYNTTSVASNPNQL